MNTAVLLVYTRRMIGFLMVDQPIRILQWGTLAECGGTEAFIMNLYRNIDRSKVQFDFLARHNAGPLVFEDEILSMGGRVHRVMFSRRERPFDASRRLVDFYRSHPEIKGVHAHATFHYAAPLAAAQKADIPLRILHAHSAGNLDFSQNRSLMHDLRTKVQVSLARRQIDRVVSDYFACSDTAANYMFPGKKYQWIKNGIDLDRFSYNPDVRHNIRTQLDISRDTTVIGYCGHLNTGKNPLFLIEMFDFYHRVNPDSKLIVIGDGNLRYRVEEKIKDCNLSSSVLLMGGSIKDVSVYYQAMDAFVLPSLSEAFPIVLQEAQCSGLPCLASTNMTSDSNTIGLVSFQSLDDGPVRWAQHLHDMIDSVTRTDHSSLLKKEGFDMYDVASFMEHFYLEKTLR